MQAVRHLVYRLQRRYPFPRHDHVVMRSVGAGHFEGATTSITGADELASASDVEDERRERSRRAVYRGLSRAWFGAWIVPLGERHRWILDGLACQLELDHEALVRGEAEAALEWEELRERLVRRARAATVPDARPEGTDLARELDALRAGWAMRMLRKQLGEQDHWRVVRRFAAVLAGPQNVASRVVTGEDFRRAALDEIGVDLGPELAQWSERIAVPELEVTIDPRGVDAGRDSVEVVVRQVQPGAPFALFLDLELHFEGGNSRVETLELDGVESRLSVRLQRPLLDVTVDPFGAILADLRVQKSEAAWLAQGLLSRPAVQRQRALPELERLALAGSAAASQPLSALLESPEPGLRTAAGARSSARGAAAPQSAADDPSPSVRAASRTVLQAFAADRWPRRRTTCRRLAPASARRPPPPSRGSSACWRRSPPTDRGWTPRRSRLSSTRPRARVRPSNASWTPRSRCDCSVRGAAVVDVRPEQEAAEIPLGHRIFHPA